MTTTTTTSKLSLTESPPSKSEGCATEIEEVISIVPLDNKPKIKKTSAKKEVKEEQAPLQQEEKQEGQQFNDKCR
uniref:Uncharacterized protein n=1 Tax=Panagrellus redivivus TaxID=6233 RepID=A0A7E4VI12_PANRE